MTRSTKDLIELVDFFNAYNCSFNSFTENIDTYSSTGRMFIKIIGIFAEFERENISERVRFGLERKVKEGYTIASKNISYGYYKNKNENVQLINQYEAYVVRKIFNLYIYGCSFSNIANYLNKFHVKRKNGIWNYKNVKLILSNPNYVGMVRHGIGTDAYFECLGNHEKIIPDELYNNVKYKIQDHSSFICVCGNKYVKKRTFYYSKKCKRISKYSRLYCKRCKTSLNLNKVYLKMKTSKTMGNIMVDENYNIFEV